MKTIKEKIDQGKKDIRRGKFLTTAELLKEVETWRRKQ